MYTPPSLSLIETHFIAKLESSRLYGDPQDGLADQLAERLPAPSFQALDTAAEQLMRHKNSGTFPRFAECLKSIEVAEKAQAPRHRHGLITKDNYTSLARARLEVNKHSAIILNCEQNPFEWAGWVRAFHSIGMKDMANFMSTRAVFQVPTMTPQEFGIAV